MRIVIDWDLCQGHGVCMGEAPEAFEVGTGGELKLLQERPPDALRAKIELAARYCPTGAITIEPD